MPSHSIKQHRFMEAIAHSPSFAKKVGVPQSVGKDFAAADKSRKFNTGDEVTGKKTSFGKGSGVKRFALGGPSSGAMDMPKVATPSKTPPPPIKTPPPPIKTPPPPIKTPPVVARAIPQKMSDPNVGPQPQKMSDPNVGPQPQKMSDPNVGPQPQATTYPKAFRALNQQQQFNEMNPNLANRPPAYKRGGEMKESKAMVGKEVAFMKKKGAPKSMLKHEESEMKGMKAGGKVRRMAMGGQGDSSYMTDEDYEKQKEQGEKNWKSVKNFFGFGEKEPAPIEERTPPKSAKTESVKEFITPTRISSSDLSSAPSKRDERPVFTGMGTFEDNAEPQRGTQTGSGAFGFPSNYKDSGFSALENKPQRNKPTTVSRTRETTSVTTGRPATGKSDSSYDAIERNRANKSPS
jgi:hypothetical protein